ncbi:MAG: CU044_5270 family protein [Actinomycetota bacterium]
MSNETETLLTESLEVLVAGQPFVPDIDAAERRGRHLRRRSHALRAVTGVGLAGVVAAAAVLAPTGTPVRVDKSPSTAAAGSSVLYRLASASAAVPALQGRYLVLSEIDTDSSTSGQSKRTSVIDTETGASTTYQLRASGGVGPEVVHTCCTSEPPVLTEGPDPTSTEAWFAALPTDPAALRAQLLSIAQQQAAAADAGLTASGKAAPVAPALSDNDYVYEEANSLLWSPLVQPALRSALYQVLAQTPGVSVNPNATDPSGRPAIAMTRTDGSAGVQDDRVVHNPSSSTDATEVTFEDPSTGAVLAQVWTVDHDTLPAVYQPATGSATIPPDPYTSAG